MRQTKLANFEYEKKWYILDVTDLVLGRFSVEVANILTGKDKPFYTPQEDYGDNVIIINADKLILTGSKLKNKKYYNHSGYPGGMRVRTAKEMINNYPEEMIRRSIWGMISHNKLGNKQIKKLHIYVDTNHKHSAQKPMQLELKK